MKRNSDLKAAPEKYRFWVTGYIILTIVIGLYSMARLLAEEIEIVQSKFIQVAIVLLVFLLGGLSVVFFFRKNHQLFKAFSVVYLLSEIFIIESFVFVYRIIIGPALVFYVSGNGYFSVKFDLFARFIAVGFNNEYVEPFKLGINIVPLVLLIMIALKIRRNEEF